MPTSVDVRQQFTAVSFVRQLVPLHLFAVCVAELLKGSAPTATPTLHTEVHAIGWELVQRVALSLAQV